MWGFIPCWSTINGDWTSFSFCVQMEWRYSPLDCMVHEVNEIHRLNDHQLVVVGFCPSMRSRGKFSQAKFLPSFFENQELSARDQLHFCIPWLFFFFKFELWKHSIILLQLFGFNKDLEWHRIKWVVPKPCKWCWSSLQTKEIRRS